LQTPTPSTMSQSNINNRVSSRGRGRGRGAPFSAPVFTPPVSGGMIGGNYIAPPLPIGIQRLIDGRNLKAISVEYSPSGANVLAVLPDDTKVPLHEWRQKREVEVKASTIENERLQFVARASSRPQLSKVSVPKSFSDRKSVDEWLGSLSAETRKLLLMSNKMFRALSSANVVSDGSGTASGANKGGDE